MSFNKVFGKFFQKIRNSGANSILFVGSGKNQVVFLTLDIIKMIKGYLFKNVLMFYNNGSRNFLFDLLAFIKID